MGDPRRRAVLGLGAAAWRSVVGACTKGARVAERPRALDGRSAPSGRPSSPPREHDPRIRRRVRARLGRVRARSRPSSQRAVLPRSRPRRSDIRENRQGVTTLPPIHCGDADGAPLKNAAVEHLHCDALGDDRRVFRRWPGRLLAVPAARRSRRTRGANGGRSTPTSPGTSHRERRREARRSGPRSCEERRVTTDNGRRAVHDSLTRW